jgi:hypothetical protein
MSLYKTQKAIPLPLRWNFKLFLSSPLIMHTSFIAIVFGGYLTVIASAAGERFWTNVRIFFKENSFTNIV